MTQIHADQKKRGMPGLFFDRYLFLSVKSALIRG